MKNPESFVFVTGGTGLVGSHLIYSLLVKGRKVRAIYRQGSNRDRLKRIFGYYYENAGELYDKIEWVECDIFDYEKLKEAIRGADIVYHCAGVVSFSSLEKEIVLSGNIRGSANVVKACLENTVPRLCHVSSNASFGATEKDTIINESHRWDEDAYHTVYAISKHLAEEEVWKGIRKGLNAVIVNPTIILGPGDWSRSSSALFSSVDKGVPFCTNGISGFVDVRDVVRAMISLSESTVTAERYIVNAENLSYCTIFSWIAENLGARKPQMRLPKIFSWPAYLFIRIYELITGKEFYLTKDILSAAWQKVEYDGSKLIKTTGIRFIPVERSIRDIAAIYLADKKNKQQH